jgi:hypothetical protein
MEYNIKMSVELKSVGVFAKTTTLPFVPVAGMRLWRRKVNSVNWDGDYFEVELKNIDGTKKNWEGELNVLRLAGWTERAGSMLPNL